MIEVIGILTDSTNPRDYWFKMKVRIKTEGGLEEAVSKVNFAAASYFMECYIFD